MTDTAWAYLVVSSEAQAETLSDQRIWAERTAREHGWEITRTFSDVATGKRGVRALLVHLLAELQAVPKGSRPGWVLMIRLDRVGRGPIVESQIVLRDLREMGVGIWTRDQGEIKLDSAIEEMITAVVLGTARIENEVRRDKSRAFHARKKAAGEYASLPPFGFVLLDKRLTIYEPEAKVVRDLYDKRIAGWGWQRLAQYAAKVAPAKLRPNGELRKLGWGQNTVTRILENPRYRGVVVPEYLWEEVAGMKGQLLGRNAPRWPWPLRGAVRCTCGAILLGEASGSKVKRNRYYVCRRFNHHENPRYPHHPAHKLEAAFVAILERLEPGDTPAYGDPAPQLDSLRRQRLELTERRAEIERRRAKVWELAEDALIGKGDLANRLEALSAQTGEVSEQLRTLDREIARIERQAHSAESIAGAFAGLPALWPKLAVEYQRDVAIGVSAYLGGLTADPREPGVLRFP